MSSPKKLLLSRLRLKDISSSKLCEDLSSIGIRLDLGHHFSDDAVFVDDEGCADDSEAYLTVELFLLPDSVSAYDIEIGVREDNEG